MENDEHGMVPLTDPKEHSVGGLWGHLLRRAVHLGMVVIPWVYYEHAADLGARLGMDSAEQFASALVLLLIVAEAVVRRRGSNCTQRARKRTLRRYRSYPCCAPLQDSDGGHTGYSVGTCPKRWNNRGKGPADGIGVRRSRRRSVG